MVKSSKKKQKTDSSVQSYKKSTKSPAPSTALTEIEAPQLPDPIKSYFKDLAHYPPMDHAEENRLALELQKTGNVDIAKRLVAANLRLVVKIAMEYRSLYANLLDLIQEGNIGLMKAVSKFDPSKGATLGYYASWWIRSYILKYLLDNFRLVKVGTTQAQKKLFYHLMKEKQRLEAQGLPAGPKLLAERLDVNESEVIEMEHRLGSSGAEVSIDAPIGGSSEDPRMKSFGQTLSDPSILPDEALAQDELLRHLEGRLPEFETTLSVRERKILSERILSEEPKTLQEIADKYGLTRERVRQIESQVMTKLKNFLAPHIDLKTR